MQDLTPIFSFLNLIGLGGVGIFIFYLFKGLNERIKTLTEITKEQDKTLSVVRERAAEMDEWRKEYKELINDFQDLGKKLDVRRNDLVKELETAISQKDKELSELKEAQLKEIDLRKKSFEKVRNLESELSRIKGELERQLKILLPSKFFHESKFIYLLLSHTNYENDLWNNYCSLRQDKSIKIFRNWITHFSDSIKFGDVKSDKIEDQKGNM